MRTHPRHPCSLTLPLLLGALALVACGPGGCGKSSDAEKQASSAAAPSSTQPHAAPTQNPLTSGTTPARPAPTTAPAPASTPLAADAKALEGGTRIEADGISFVVPEDWEREVVTSSMRAAQYKVPALKGEGMEGTFVVFRGIGGTPEDNIERWIGQITEKPTPPERATVDIGGGLTVYTVKMVGTYTVGTMMGGSGNPEPDTMFLGAVITGGPGPTPVFLRLTGPRTTVEPRVAEWNAVLASSQAMSPGMPGSQ